MHAGHGYSADTKRLTTRLRRIEGQVRGVERMVEDDRHRIDILTQIAAIQAGLDKVALSLLDQHTQHCVAQATGPDRDAKLAELTAATARLLRRG